MQGMGKYEKAPQSMHIKPINGDAAHRASVLSKEQPSSMPQGGPGGGGGKGVLGSGNSMPFNFPSTFIYHFRANRTRGIK